MAIDAITSSGGAAAAVSTQMRAQPTEQDAQARKAQNDSARLEREATERSRVQNAQVAQAAQAEQAKPTVNAEGQKVGMRVNTTA